MSGAFWGHTTNFAFIEETGESGDPVLDLFDISRSAVVDRLTVDQVKLIAESLAMWVESVDVK